jgi:hypothetical protein
MPLLNICAITGNNMVIQVGLVFLSSEKEADYTWAVNYLRGLMAENTIKEPYSIVTDRELALIRALKSQFPNSQHLLCRWHVNMNVLAKTRQFFPAPTRVEGRIIRHPRFQEFLSSWNSLLASSTEDLYRRQLVAMHAKYPINAMKYCTDTWLIWKENLVAYYINQYCHFGVTVTSPIEGCHATIKGYLQRGHGDLKGVFTKLRLFWDAQHIAIESTQAQQQIKPRHSTNIPLFAAVLGRVHSFALHKITQEVTRLPLSGPPRSECSCTIRQSFGLPCHHEIWEIKAINRTIQLEDIHPHWYFTREDEATSLELSRPLPVLNPLVIQGRGRPRGALGGVVRPTNTRREPSSFENPPSSAPPAFNHPQERLYIVNSGLTRLDNGYQDTYEPGTLAERAYMRPMASIYQPNSMEDAATVAGRLMEEEVLECIEVDCN